MEGGGREGGMEGVGREEERERGRDDCYTYILMGMFNFFYRNVLFVNSNMMHMLPTVHRIHHCTIPQPF